MFSSLRIINEMLSKFGHPYFRSIVTAILCQISHRERHFKLRLMDLLFKSTDNKLQFLNLIEYKIALRVLECKTLIIARMSDHTQPNVTCYLRILRVNLQQNTFDLLE